MINATLQNNSYNRTSRKFRVTSVPEQQSYIAVRLLFEYTSVPWKTWTGLLNSVHLSHWIVRTHCPCTAGITIAGNILCEESFYLSTVSLFIIIIILFGIFMHESSVFLSVLSALFYVKKAYEMIKAIQALHVAGHSGFYHIRAEAKSGYPKIHEQIGFDFNSGKEPKWVQRILPLLSWHLQIIRSHYLQCSY